MSPCRIAALVALLTTAPARADWPEWCGGPSRNNVSTEKGLVDGFEEPAIKPLAAEGRDEPFRGKAGVQGPALPKLRNVRWSAPIGVSSYGSPTVANGRVFIGGCIDHPGSADCTAGLWCFKESDGSLLWCLRSPYVSRLYNRSFGISAAPTVEGDRLYIIDHLGDVLCLDVNGLANGNDGPVKNEHELLARGRTLLKSEIGPDGKTQAEITPGRPAEILSTDADIIWRFDMYRELNCAFYNSLTSAILIRGDLLFMGTCATNVRKGVNPYPAPVFIALDKQTGKLVAVNDQSIAPPGYHGAHSSPTFGLVNGRELIFYGNGRGMCYAFDPHPAPGKDGKPGTLKVVWHCDITEGKSHHEIVATPVFHKNRIYVALGNDLIRSGSRAGSGRLVCIDATKTGDITRSGMLWKFDQVRSSSSTVAIVDDLLFAADAAGNVFCLDAETGRMHWQHETGPVWSSPLVADGKLYVFTHGRGLLVMAASKTKRVISQGNKLTFAASPAVSNGTIYAATLQHLYALKAE